MVCLSSDPDPSTEKRPIQKKKYFLIWWDSRTVLRSLQAHTLLFPHFKPTLYAPTLFRSSTLNPTPTLSLQFRLYPIVTSLRYTSDSVNFACGCGQIECNFDPKFDSAVVSDYAAGVSIEWKITSAYSPRGNEKLERMVGTLKRAVQKALIRNKDRDWYKCLWEIVGGYNRPPGIDGKSLFEILFLIRPKFSVELPRLK